MQHYESKKVENCFSGTNMYEYRLDIDLDEEVIAALGLTGEIRYFRQFPRPFFQVIFPDGTILKGIINSTNLKVVFPNRLIMHQKNFEKLLQDILQTRFCQ